MPRLIAIDRPGGAEFVRDLQEIWSAGDAAFPVDQRLPAAARRMLLEHMRVGEEVEPGDALVLATSGSTGSPKGVVLTHDAVAASADATNARLGVTDDDHWLACLPLSHVGGLSVITRSLRRGTRLTVHPSFDAEAAMSSGATLISLVATALQRIDPALFRTIVLGGSRAPADRPANSVTTYGMTETGSGVVYDGVPLDDVEVDIAPSERGADSPDGEIRLRGPMLLRCYRDGGDPVTADGWFPTGDLGHWLPDGRLHVTGRSGDLIITGGENVWPETVERILESHPGIAAVMVRSRPHPEWGQIVEAVVVPVDRAAPPTLDALRDHAKRDHPAYMAPRSIEYVDELPRTSLGKVRRQSGARSGDPATPAPPSIT